jgi:hypothetical protein
MNPSVIQKNCLLFIFSHKESISRAKTGPRFSCKHFDREFYRQMLRLFRYSYVSRRSDMAVPVLLSYMIHLSTLSPTWMTRQADRTRVLKDAMTQRLVVRNRTIRQAWHLWAYVLVIDAWLYTLYCGCWQYFEQLWLAMCSDSKLQEFIMKHGDAFRFCLSRLSSYLLIQLGESVSTRWVSSRAWSAIWRRTSYKKKHHFYYTTVAFSN